MASHVLVDFQLLNETDKTFGDGKDHVHVTVTGPGITGTLEQDVTKIGTPLYLDALQTGAYTVKLDLLGGNGFRPSRSVELGHPDNQHHARQCGRGGSRRRSPGACPRAGGYCPRRTGTGSSGSRGSGALSSSVRAAHAGRSNEARDALYGHTPDRVNSRPIGRRAAPYVVVGGAAEAVAHRLPPR